MAKDSRRICHSLPNPWFSLLLDEVENNGLKEEIAKDILCADSVNLAHTAQKYFEEILIDAAKNMYKKTGCKNFALSGGSLLNCSANGQLLKQDFVEEIFVQPASHDAGAALGAAILGEAKQKNKILPLDFNTAYTRIVTGKQIFLRQNLV